MSHLTLENRITIQEGLNNGESIRCIAGKLNKSPSTILREIRRNRIYNGKRDESMDSPCKFKENCTIERLCSDIRCYSPCRNCVDCTKKCPRYSPAKCEKLDKSPYVCNSCNKFRWCSFERITYSAVLANNKYITTLVESRDGISSTPDELQRLDELLTPLILKGQSLSHIYASHENEIPISMQTLYRYIDLGVFSFKNVDLRRKVKFRKRISMNDDIRLTKEVKSDILYRNYNRFLEYISANPDVSVVQMDTVVGCLGSHKVLLTLLFCSCNLMLAVLLPSKSQEAVINALNDICRKLGIELFRSLFGVIVTDRGTEFYNPGAMECDEWGEIKTKVFYCDPQASDQKAAIERNHEFIRYILPKGSSFDDMTQDDITLMINHINSVSRKKYGGATPYDLSVLMLDNKLHEVMNLRKIPSDEVMLRPTLFKYKNI